MEQAFACAYKMIACYLKIHEQWIVRINRYGEVCGNGKYAFERYKLIVYQ